MNKNRTILLSPSILAADFMKLGEQVKVLEEEGVPYLHIDVMDGLFVPSISMGFPVVASLRKGSKMFFDVHLMITDPIRYLEQFVKSGADMVTFHYEAGDLVMEGIEQLRKLDCKVGLSISPGTASEVLLPYLSMVDQILIMTVEPGFGGQRLIPETIEKVRFIAKKREELNLDYRIEVDGGVTLDNVETLLEAGADVIVAGTSVFRGDIAANVKGFQEIFQRRQTNGEQ